jgi:hypothetical protein
MDDHDRSSADRRHGRGTHGGLTETIDRCWDWLLTVTAGGGAADRGVAQRAF